MSVFDTINDALLAAAAQAQGAGGAGPQPGQNVDVEAAKLQAKGNPDPNWKSSIVDLMKLLDLD